MASGAQALRTFRISIIIRGVSQDQYRRCMKLMTSSKVVVRCVRRHSSAQSHRKAFEQRPIRASACNCSQSFQIWEPSLSLSDCPFVFVLAPAVPTISRGEHHGLRRQTRWSRTIGSSDTMRMSSRNTLKSPAWFRGTTQHFLNFAKITSTCVQVVELTQMWRCH